MKKNKLTLSEISNKKSWFTFKCKFDRRGISRKEIFNIALYIKNTTIQSIYVTTNASLPERVFCKKYFFDKNIQLTFQISIDDLPERHDEVRKIHNFL